MIDNKSVTQGLSLIEQDTSKVLGLKVGSHEVTPGKFVPKADAQAAPELSYSKASPSQTYLAIGLDLDAPFQTFSPMSPILHWIIPGLRAVAGSSSLQSSDSVVASYLAPSPPPPSGPHRYVFMLYEQPDDFEAKKYAPPSGQEMGIWPRIRFDLDGWEKKAGLASAVAVNYFNSN